jgi:hypothetical protein
MARSLIYHPESDCVFETFDDNEVDQAELFGQCFVVTGNPEYEKRFREEQMAKQVTIKKTFTRDELVGVSPRTGKQHEYSPINSGNFLTNRLLEAGIPVIGAFGILAVEWGVLTITYDGDGLDGDEWEFAWTGEKMPEGWPKRGTANAIEKLAMDKPLKQLIAEDDEL